jgi:cyclase
MRTDAKRVIARLDIKGPNLIKGIELDGQRVLGKAWDFAKKYYLEGVDELIFQDTVASLYRRNSLKSMVQKAAKEAFIPMTVAGGLRSVEDIREALHSGADKVAINTAAVENPKLIREASRVFGAQCIVSSIEAFRKDNGQYEVWVDYGREPTRMDAFDWAKKVVDLGAGEILLTSINRDGTGSGYDYEMIQKMVELVDVPVIASGGAGSAKDVSDLFTQTKVDAAAIGSVFHYHYSQAINVESDYRKSLENLRMGEHVDTGNMDFIYYGYGGSRDLLVDPCSVGQMKRHLKESGQEIRL